MVLQIKLHYCDVIMGSITSQIISLTIVYSSVYLGADQRKHQSSASLAFVRGIHRRPVNSPHKGPVTRIFFHLMTSSYRCGPVAPYSDRDQIKISLWFVPKSPINNIPAFVEIMAWRHLGDKPLSEPTMDSLLTHICVTRPQWVRLYAP